MAARYLVTIDYAHQLMTLSLPRLGFRPAGIAVPFVFDQTIPMIATELDGIPVRSVIDTGNRAALVLSSPFVESHNLRSIYAHKVAGNIGGGVLKRFTVTFDYAHQMMYLAKNEDFARSNDGDRSGLVLIDGHAGITVIGVLSATPAQRVGLRSGDRILALNGAPAKRVGLIKIRQLLSAPAGTIVRLSVMSGTQVRAINLKLLSYV